MSIGMYRIGLHQNKVPKSLGNTLKTIKSKLSTIGFSRDTHPPSCLAPSKPLKVDDLYNLVALKLYHKYSNIDLPPYFATIFDNQTPTHNYNTRYKNNTHQQPNTISASHSPRYCIPRLVESLPESIISMVKEVSLKGFSSANKKHFLSNYQNECLVYNCYICNEYSH